MSQTRTAQAETPGIVEHEFKVAKCGGKLTVYLSEDGTPCEIQIKTFGAAGARIGSALNAFAEVVTMGLQRSIPLNDFCEQFISTEFRSHGEMPSLVGGPYETSNPDIPFAESVIDYVFTWLAIEFLSPDHGEIPDPDEADAPEPEGGVVVDLQERIDALNRLEDPFDGTEGVREAFPTPPPPPLPPRRGRRGRRPPPVDKRQTSLDLGWPGSR